MTTQEFSDQFDILFNNVGSAQSPGINEYEKAVFLTKAEKQLVREYFDSRLNRSQAGFDGNIKRQYDFSSLMKTTKLYDITHHWNNENLSLRQDTFNLDGIPFVLPNDYYLSVNELITDNKNNKYSVLPLTYEDFQLKQSKPFPFPNKREAWRIITNQRGINYGAQSITYTGVPSKDLAEVICSTTFASEGKDMRFTLRERTNLDAELSSLRTQGIINDEIWTIYQTFNDIDGYASLKREANYHNLEAVSMSIHHTEEPQKVKLWDDDYIAEWTYDKVTNAAGKEVDCVYQDTSAIAITSVTVKGEASALGLLKTYMHLTEVLENDSIGHDPYTLIARINFKHWEEGTLKYGTWVIWNGGWGYPNTIKFHKLDTPIQIRAATSSGYPMISYTNNGTIKKTFGVVLADSSTSSIVSAELHEGIKADKSACSPLAAYVGKYIIGYYVSVPSPKLDEEYNIPFLIEYWSDLNTGITPAKPFVPWSDNVLKYTPTAEYTDGTGAAERLDMVNVRHWDYADNFVWPQRIKFKDMTSYEPNAVLFEVNMKASTVPAVEIIGKFKGGVQSYMMRYVRKPKPIILQDISEEGLSIDGYTSVMECELPEECHEEILERAVTLAKLAYGGTTMTAAQSNNNKE